MGCDNSICYCFMISCRCNNAMHSHWMCKPSASLYHGVTIFLVWKFGTLRFGLDVNN